MTDLAMGQDQWLGSYYPEYSEWDSRVETGRHAFNEDAVLTPIFHALTSGGWQERQRDNGASHNTRRAGDPVDDFHRDPLSAPIPQQAFGTDTEQPWRRSSSRLRSVTTDDAGRHRRRREAWQA